MLQTSVPNVSSVFQTYVTSVFIWMLHVFHTYVASVYLGVVYVFSMAFQVFFYVFASVSDACFKFSVFTRMLQIFHLDVSKNKSGVASERAVSVWGQTQASGRARLSRRLDV
jgi:hypothetical protein